MDKLIKKKTLFRVIITLAIILITQLKIIEYYGELSSCLILILLIFDLFEKNHSNHLKPELVYYSSWVIIGLSTFSIRGSYIGPYTSIFLIFVIKLTTLVFYYLKYKSLLVTRTLLSKFCLVTIALYFIELLSNSTHGFSHITLFWTKIASIELFIILIIKKKRIKYQLFFLDFLWKK
ncbi:hypothetical protein DFQ07_1719 [Tenacibaculum caenipelagi]|uniref:Uncharacterized protein n=1 Tax=Tenacibaculum caenipelagi TaxID=1325435 RepID=A0A4R6THS2_9FLAO|nr:hypothetical protein DFQ07_1719 [Tenacibaculum caenipelagi]